MFSPFAGARRARRLIIAALALTAIAVPNAATASAATSVAGSVNFMRTAEGSVRHLHVEPDDRAEGLDEGALLAHARLRAVLRLAPELVLEGVVLPERLRRSIPVAPSTPSTPNGSCATPPATSSTSRSPAPAASARSTPPTSATPLTASGGSTRPAPRLAKGYAGIYIDDVNLYRKVSNGLGQAVAPIDPRTGAAMSEPTWQRYLGDHMQGVRAAFPTTEIVHNSIWFAGDTTADQLRVHKRRDPDQPRARRQRRRPHGRDRQVELPGAAGLHRPSPGRGARGRLRRHLDHRRRPPLRARRLLPDLLRP